MGSYAISCMLVSEKEDNVYEKLSYGAWKSEDFYALNK